MNVTNIQGINKTLINNLQGVVGNNGYIEFATSKSALKYAKEFIFDGLKSIHPHERAVILKDKTIYKTCIGNANSIHFPDISGLPAGLTCIHGHPSIDNGYGTALSIDDFYILLTRQELNSMKSVTLSDKWSKMVKTEKNSVPINRIAFIIAIKTIYTAINDILGKLTDKILKNKFRPRFTMDSFWKQNTKTLNSAGITYKSNIVA